MTKHGPDPSFLVSPPSHLTDFYSLPQCLPKKQPIPTETFQVADSHPEVAQRVEPMGPLKTPLFHSKYHYQKVVVHRMQASNGETFHVLYLTTGDGLSQNSPPPLIFYFVKTGFEPGVVAPAHYSRGRGRRISFVSFTVSLVYRVSSRPVKMLHSETMSQKE